LFHDRFECGRLSGIGFKGENERHV